jgi:hypothetical protein
MRRASLHKDPVRIITQKFKRDNRLPRRYCLDTSTNVSKYSTPKNKKSPGFSLGAQDFEVDKTLVAPIEYTINDTSHDEQSSEGEDWDDGQTLVSRFMDVDPESVS